MALKDLTFSKTGDRYTADVTVSNDYALHIERAQGGFFHIFQRSSDEGEYANCPLPPHLEWNSGKVIDHSFCHGVYPMNVRIVSETEVTSATIREAE